MTVLPENNEWSRQWNGSFWLISAYKGIKLGMAISATPDPLLRISLTKKPLCKDFFPSVTPHKRLADLWRSLREWYCHFCSDSLGLSYESSYGNQATVHGFQGTKRFNFHALETSPVHFSSWQGPIFCGYAAKIITFIYGGFDFSFLFCLLDRERVAQSLKLESLNIHKLYIVTILSAATLWRCYWVIFSSNLRYFHC